MATYGLLQNIKIGEAARPSTYKKPVQVPEPKTNEQQWQVKSKLPPHVWSTRQTAADEANAVAQAWMSHPANKMQLPSLQKAADTDGDGLIDTAEFKKLLASAGSGADASHLFAQMDTDGDGVLTEAEIKMLGHGKSGR